MPDARFHPGRDVPTTGRVTGVLGAGTSGVDGAHRVAVHRGVVESGQREVGTHVLGEQQALGVEQSQVDRIERADAVEHDREVLVDRAQASVVRHAVIPPSVSMPLLHMIPQLGETRSRMRSRTSVARRSTS